MVNEGACLTDDAVESFLRGAMSSSDRMNAERHLSLCSSCRGRLVALHDDPIPEPAPIPPALLMEARRIGRRGRAPRVYARVMALAAMLAFAVFGVYLFRASRANDGVLRDVQRDVPVIAAAPRLLLPEEGARVSARAVELRWEPAAGVMRYDVRIVDERGDIVMERSTTDAAVRLPEARDSLRSGERYYWLVRARWPDGRVAESGLRSFIAAE